MLTTPPPPTYAPTAPTRLLWLDTLRVFAICLVVGGHIAQAIWPPWGQVLYNHFFDLSIGKAGVVIFLFVSGVGLHLSQKRRRTSLFRFYTDRLWRIYPMYWLVLPIGFTLGVLRHEPFIRSWDEGLLTVSGFCAFAGRWGCQLTMGWFIGLIISLYLMYPLLAKAIRWHAPAALGIFFAVSVLSRLVVESAFSGYPLEWFPLCRLFEFGLGIYCADRTSLTGASSPAWLAYLSDIAFPLYLSHYSFTFLFYRLPSPLNLLAYLTLILIVGAALFTAERQIKRFLTRAWQSLESPISRHNIQ